MAKKYQGHKMLLYIKKKPESKLEILYFYNLLGKFTMYYLMKNEKNKNERLNLLITILEFTWSTTTISLGFPDKIKIRIINNTIIVLYHIIIMWNSFIKYLKIKTSNEYSIITQYFFKFYFTIFFFIFTFFAQDILFTSVLYNNDNYK